MLSLVSDFGEPLARLAIHVIEICELTQRPEVLAHISDGALHLAFGEKRALQTDGTSELLNEWKGLAQDAGRDAFVFPSEKLTT